ncbi:MAE_28990/MAE_18760 family HEPN-like nuclease [Dactylosporangium sp. AC04546]|uniref:MAE_28990/MAE_18760 family HEPN-like nuclease n=1 Tax=Dactylosporangium sp. AC04546 TaxID=2862460 RepID=UPI001EDF69F4|nr:MAE_28990/MAE_18760 family HEPN-like nuclease [Dactylosporangium sp. AC04546]WVK82305.1 MAE_28990/MAE_18760 family HEPN-like nuclease [Dactylosporangium sp. AC04546]
MNPLDVREQLEEDVTWRLDELRHLRNQLLGELDRKDWPASAMRAILVMQYAHLEGFARNAFSVYVAAVNDCQLSAKELHEHLFACALVPEFDALRRGAVAEVEAEDGAFMRRARHQVQFVKRIRALHEGPLLLDPDAAVSMEMNFGADVFRRTLFRLGIQETEVSRSYYQSLEFVRNMRNDIAHGSRKNRIAPGEFEAHRLKSERFMAELTRLITTAVEHEWFRVPNSHAS